MVFLLAHQELSSTERQPAASSEYPIDLCPFIPGSDNSDIEIDDSSSDEGNDEYGSMFDPAVEWVQLIFPILTV